MDIIYYNGGIALNLRMGVDGHNKNVLPHCRKYGIVRDAVSRGFDRSI